MQKWKTFPTYFRAFNRNWFGVLPCWGTTDMAHSFTASFRAECPVWINIHFWEKKNNICTHKEFPIKVHKADNWIVFFCSCSLSLSSHLLKENLFFCFFFVVGIRRWPFVICSHIERIKNLWNKRGNIVKRNELSMIWTKKKKIFYNILSSARWQYTVASTLGQSL